MLAHTRRLAAPPGVVWDVLADGWLYPLFVVGTTSMRAVDASWPAEGSQLYHATGVWPVLIQDSTQVRSCVPGSRLELLARGWPLGEALVVMTVAPAGTGSVVSIAEDAVKGPGALVPRFARQAASWVRNGETLRRLDHLTRGRAGLGSPPGAF